MIPLLIGGAAAAGIAVIAKSVSSTPGGSSSQSSSTQIESKERELERQRRRNEAVARKDNLRRYTERVTSNLARKYGISDASGLSDVLTSELMSNGEFAAMSSTPPYTRTLLGIKDSKSILYKSARFQSHQQKIERVERQLLGYEKALEFLEEIDGRFK
ncbi:hypothetical protein [Salinisphaera hydrothermalis]|uniref:hypothetical protein n=1 Tax=Salinisphaera hydrothermalis TaxID=563188 RepID=UPI00333EA572